MTEREVRNLIRSHAERAGSVATLAKEWGISQAYLDKQIRGTQAIGDLTLRRLKLIRRKAYQFYPESRGGLNELASEVGTMIADHESAHGQRRGPAPPGPGLAHDGRPGGQAAGHHAEGSATDAGERQRLPRTRRSCAPQAGMAGADDLRLARAKGLKAIRDHRLDLSVASLPSPRPFSPGRASHHFGTSPEDENMPLLLQCANNVTAPRGFAASRV